MKNFTSFTQDQLIDFIVNKVDITFETTHELAKFTGNLEDGVSQEFQISTSNITEILKHLMFQGNNHETNFEVLRLFTIHQKGRFIYTKQGEKCFIEIKY